MGRALAKTRQQSLTQAGELALKAMPPPGGGAAVVSNVHPVEFLEDLIAQLGSGAQDRKAAVACLEPCHVRADAPVQVRWRRTSSPQAWSGYGGR